ncbi:MAG TPA: response regulator, partial [Ramlibacter sp.]|nr:response regulator [Ramlibacter sp.]
DGSIEARSAGPGRGAEFLIRFPRARAQEPVTRTGSARGDLADTVPAVSKPTASPLRLLVVDDNRDAAESLALLLQMKGHTAFTAADGQSALKAAAQEHPDFVFLDIGLPDMTGHEVALRLRQQVRGKQPTVVALTGWGSADDVQRSRRNGFDGHLTKPISLEQIEAALLIRHETDAPAVPQACLG